MRLATAIIGRRRRRETGVGEAMIETCLAGVPTRRIEDVPEVPLGSGVSASTAPNPSEKAFASVEEWCNGLLSLPAPTPASTASTSSAAGAVLTRASRRWRR